MLPPHFSTENEHVKEAMQLSFGSIISTWGEKCSITGVLKLFLARSIVYHHEFLETKIANNHDGENHLIHNTEVKDMNADFIETTFNAARAHLERKYPHLFQGVNGNINRQVRVATWSRKVREENRAIQDGI